MGFIVLGLGGRGWGLGAWGWGWGVGVFNPSLSKAMLPILSNPGTVYDKKFALLSGFHPECYKKKKQTAVGPAENAVLSQKTHVLFIKEDQKSQHHVAYIWDPPPLPQVQHNMCTVPQESTAQ